MGWLDEVLERLDNPEAQPREIEAPKPRQRRKPRPIVKHFYTQVSAPQDNYPGRVESSFYVVEGGFVVLTDRRGTPVSEQYRHQLKAGEHEERIARALARNMWSEKLGRDLNRPRDDSRNDWVA